MGKHTQVLKFEVPDTADTAAIEKNNGWSING
jgi:hypothetical protein